MVVFKGHHHSDLFDMTFPDYVLNSPGSHRQQHPQNRSFTMGLNPPESPPPPEGQDRLHPHSPHHDRTYHFMRENLGRRSFPLDRASHVIVQNEQTKVGGISAYLMSTIIAPTPRFHCSPACLQSPWKKTGK